MVTSRDVQEIVAKLSSDKTKAREPISLHLHVDELNDLDITIYAAETWPFLVTLLIKCASLEISASKRRLPKLVFAKTLRIIIQRAEEAKYSGGVLPLLTVAKTLFNHVCDVLSNVPSFQSEYGIILRHLLAVRDYRFHLRKHIYCNMVCLHIEKVESGLSENNNSQHHQKEDVFRFVLILHSLLENPPGDFQENLREDIVQGFVRIFSFVRDEGKTSRKLLECINTYLIKDGPNLGSKTVEIHNALQQFVFRSWLTTHDRGLKDVFIFYSRLQLNLTRTSTDGSPLLEQILDVICKELDQNSLVSAALPWGDASKDDKYGNLSNSQRGLVELAALVLYRASVNSGEAPSTEKRVRRVPTAAYLKEALTKGKWLWSFDVQITLVYIFPGNAAFCYLTRSYYNRISEDLFMYWFEGIYTSFQRILNDANMGHTYGGLLWTLSPHFLIFMCNYRSLQELSSVMLLPDSKEISSRPSTASYMLSCGWQLIWSCLMHGLPIFSNVTKVADATLTLLGSIISSDLVKTYVVPQDVWDLPLFKQTPSMSALYFIACYFSRKGSQHLTCVLYIVAYCVESTMLNERLVFLLPAAVYSLCVGCDPFTDCYKRFFLSHSLEDATEAVDDRAKTDNNDQETMLHLFDCSVEILAKIDAYSGVQVYKSRCHQSIRLPAQLKDTLLHEMETYIIGALVDDRAEKSPVSEVFCLCALSSNFINGSLLTRKKDEVVSFVSKLGQYLLESLDHVVRLIHESQHDQSLFEFSEKSSIIASFRSFVSSTIFAEWGKQNAPDSELYHTLVKSMEKMLKALAKMYEKYECVNAPEISASDDITTGDRSTIVDMELDANEDRKDVDILKAGGKNASAISNSAVNWKLDMISLMSSFFLVSRVVTWDTLFDLMEKERDPKVNSMVNMIEVQADLKLDRIDMLSALHVLLRPLDTVGKEIQESVPEECLIRLGDLLNKVSKFVHLDWFGRVKLVDCICNFILLSPHVGQMMIENLLLMLQDGDYRVRLFLARRIDILFQTWDGHEELFQDICSNFGVALVVSSRGKLVTAREVLAAGSQPRPLMETVIVTLMHLALSSEKIELEAVFMMCVVSAIDPCHRELVKVALDNISKQLQYSSRQKYMEELMGAIIFCWVSCGVSLAALVEIRQLFVTNAEPSYFLQYCCNWLLPALILHEDNSNLNWVAKIACQPLAALVKDQFVPIFSVCISLHCSKRSESEKGAIVLQSSILHLAELSENERDHLIKKNMFPSVHNWLLYGLVNNKLTPHLDVSIVSYILSLASCEKDLSLPFFSRDIVSRAIQTVVDGFLEAEDNPPNIGVLDKINVFRPDRVFMFIVQLHYKITSAMHHRHKCHRLAGIEVLISVIGCRASVSSTFNYVFNLIGQFIGCHSLQDQCCRIVSALLEIFKKNPSKEIISFLGEQLQFLVSKLVECSIPAETYGEVSSSVSSQVLLLLRQLTVDSDPSLHEYVRELEPLPELEVFNEIRQFHEESCRAYCPTDHLLKLAKRSCHLPPRLLLWSFRALHKKLVIDESARRDKNVEDTSWHDNKEIVDAVWALVSMCGSDDANSIRELVSDFMSRAGIGDPHSVVFHLPGNSGHLHVFQPTRQDSATETTVDTSLSDELLIALLKVLKKYLMDDSVNIIDITCQTLRGILSTERGQGALLPFDSNWRSHIGVHSKGININLVETMLLDLERKFKAETISLEKSDVWETQDKTFDTWICPLVYSLITYCNDVILRLCQDVVFLKAEIAELLLPSILVNIAGRKDLDADLQKLISMQVQEHIFTESNTLIKSIQVILNALNELRLFHVMERSSSKQESSKQSKPSSYSSRSRSSSTKSKDSPFISNATTMSTSSWDKVYWLSIDYLVVAKSAVICGSYFTAVMYVEHWCEQHFNSLTLGSPDFSHLEMIPDHIGILISAVTQINEPDGLYGIIQSHNLTSQIITFEHEGNWSKALEYYDLQVQTSATKQKDCSSSTLSSQHSQPANSFSFCMPDTQMRYRKPYKGIIRSLQQIGCTHVLNLYCQGLASWKGEFQHDPEFSELQYEAAWRSGQWDFSYVEANSSAYQHTNTYHFNENLHSCLRALQEGDSDEFHQKLKETKQELVCSVSRVSEESTVYIYSTIIKLQILYHLGIAWSTRWPTSSCRKIKIFPETHQLNSEAVIPTMEQLSWMNMDWSSILRRTKLHMDFLEPFIAFRRVLLQILTCKDCTVHHLLQSASTLRKGSRFSQAAAAMHEFKSLFQKTAENSTLYWLGRLEEAKLLRAQGQNEMAISLAKYICHNYQFNDEASDVHRLVGKWLGETRSSDSRTILDKYLKPAVSLAEDCNTTSKKTIERQCQTLFHLAHYTDALFKSYEERLSSTEWKAAMRLRKHKTIELEALIRRLKSTTKGDKTDYSMKIQELQKQLSMYREEAEKLQADRDNFLDLALEGYKRCLVIGDKYDVRVVFRLVSLWFNLSNKQNVIKNMLDTVDEVQSYKFIPLVYQIASRLGSSKDGLGPHNFQSALVSLVRKMAMDHPYHTIFQLLALANGDRIKDKQRSKSSFIVDLDKKITAENLLEELSAHHGPMIVQMRRMVEIYIKLAELETKREDTNKRVALPREIRSVRQLELVPVVTATFPVDRSCRYPEGSFPYFKGLSDSVMVMNGINAPKVVECLGSDGCKYRQLAKSGNDDLRQDAVMEQFFGLVNTFLQNHRDTWKRRLSVRTYKVIPFTPSAGVLEWVNGTLPLGDYLIGSTRDGGAHGRYGVGDWSFSKCREHMFNAKDKRKAFQEVTDNFRPLMHKFFLERFKQPADWFEKRLAYTRSVAASSMVGYIVGLGDRHALNILIDQVTAEVVHIDLGVAFEQGLMLKTPERVPFRLTRDVIDGMGVTGVEGVFRKCCEETLGVMRTNKDALLTIVEVFIHDPLYKWALSPLKALQRQKETDDDPETNFVSSEDEYEGNKDAARALMRVKQKLDGYEEGEMRSVHGQVQQLIQDAIDTDRLCQMFAGWGAWM
ncbi:hypothetical protein ACFE04_018866 [Oxalis oulophora]